MICDQTWLSMAQKACTVAISGHGAEHQNTIYKAQAKAVLAPCTSPYASNRLCGSFSSVFTGSLDGCSGHRHVAVLVVTDLVSQSRVAVCPTGCGRSCNSRLVMNSAFSASPSKHSRKPSNSRQIPFLGYGRYSRLLQFTRFR